MCNWVNSVFCFFNVLVFTVSLSASFIRLLVL